MASKPAPDKTRRHKETAPSKTTKPPGDSKKTGKK